MATHFFAALSGRIAELTAQGVDIIRLDEGSPDMPPSAEIIKKLARTAEKPEVHGYQPHRGLIELRKAWADLYRREYDIHLDPGTEVLPLLGSKEGIFHLSLAFIDPGDVILVPDPGYVTYSRGGLIAGGRLEPMALTPERDYLPDLVAIPEDIYLSARMMWLNYPNNPTGATATKEFFSQAVSYARKYNFLICQDAAYQQVVFEGYRSPSILEIPGAVEVAVEFNSLSKSHNMAGWRSAVVVGSAEVINSLYTLKTNADSGHFKPILQASIQALRGDQAWIGERNELYKARRDVVIAGFSAVGLAPRVPRASMYVWSPVPDGWSSQDFAIAALENAHVSLVPGTVFGPGGEGYIRAALTVPVKRMEMAMDRLKEWLKR